MKILVSLHDLALGGTTVNAIELAAALRDQHGHDVILFGSPGPMSRLVCDAGLRFVPAPVARSHPSPARMQALRTTVKKERPDLLHVWETWACLDAYCAVHLPMGVPMLVTDMQMELTQVLPTNPTTTFGTPELVDRARAAGRRRVELLLPPVDTRLNAPGLIDPKPFRELCGVKPGELMIVTVSRLVDSLKGESLRRTIHAVRALGHSLPIRLIIVGDGSARESIEALANSVNIELGREAVVMPGAMLDPRPAYAAADVVVGMGGSALRAMAFGKPTIVVGERAFSGAITPQTAPGFLYKGMYGVADGDPGGTALIDDIRSIVANLQALPALGEFSRQFVVEHFSLEVVASQLSAICQTASQQRPGFLATSIDSVRTAAIYLRQRRFLWRSVPPPQLKSINEVRTSP
jgi:L-malate glycosyltransferase